jgi:ABC-type multidrug transport system fused ATPase/permease subunit
MVGPLPPSESDLDLESQGLLSSHSRKLDRLVSSSSAHAGARFQVRRLTRIADSGEKILDEVSFDAYPGKIVGLIGPSGSGKSTLLRALNRLWEPASGSVLLDGVDITSLDVVKLRRRVGMLFQTAALFDGKLKRLLSGAHSHLAIKF